MSETCHPRIVNGAGLNSGALATPTMIPFASAPSKTVIFDEAKSQHPFVKCPRLSRVSGGNEGNNIDRTQHSVLLDLTLYSA